MCSSMNSSSTNETDDSGMSVVAVALCLSVTIFGDDIVDGDMEYINVNFTASNDQGFFVGPTLAQVFIMDDDGELTLKQCKHAASPIIQLARSESTLHCIPLLIISSFPSAPASFEFFLFTVLSLLHVENSREPTW